MASHDALRETLENWDISKTETLLQKIERDKEKRREDDKARIAAETSKSVKL